MNPWEKVPPCEPRLLEVNVSKPLAFKVAFVPTVCLTPPSFLQTTEGPFTVALYVAGLKRQLVSGGVAPHAESSCMRTFALVGGVWVRM